MLREDFRNLTMADLERQAEEMPWGTADEVAERIIAAADSAGANKVQLSLNRGALPHELFMEQIRRFAREVLPRLQAHEVKRVPAAEEVPACRVVSDGNEGTCDGKIGGYLRCAERTVATRRHQRAGGRPW